MVALVGLAVVGCASSSTTLGRPDLGPGQFIYRMSEEKAFTSALDSYARLLPKQSVDDVVEGRRRGYKRSGGPWLLVRYLWQWLDADQWERDPQEAS